MQSSLPYFFDAQKDIEQMCRNRKSIIEVRQFLKSVGYDIEAHKGLIEMIYDWELISMYNGISYHLPRGYDKEPLRIDDFIYKGTIYLPCGVVIKSLPEKKCKCGRTDVRLKRPVAIVANPELSSGYCDWCRPIQMVFSPEPTKHIGVK